MTQYEEYKQTGMLGGYKPEEMRGKSLGDGKVIPLLRDTQCNIEKETIELQRPMYVGGRVFKVTSVFRLAAEKTATESMLRLIEHDLEKQ